MINHLVKKKIIVDAIEVNGGWMEIRSKEHFDYANKLFK